MPILKISKTLKLMRRTFANRATADHTPLRGSVPFLGSLRPGDRHPAVLECDNNYC